MERLALSADRSRLASVAHDSTLRLWDLGFLRMDDTDESGDEAYGEPAASANGIHPGDQGAPSSSGRPDTQAAPAAAIDGAQVRTHALLRHWRTQDLATLRKAHASLHEAAVWLLCAWHGPHRSLHLRS